MFFIVAPMFFFVIGAIQIRDDDDTMIKISCAVCKSGPVSRLQ